MERYSKQRELILNVLKERKDHPTAEMIYKDIIKIMPTIGIATVYRNLAALYESGQILKIETKQGESDRFDGNLMPHLHFQCFQYDFQLFQLLQFDQQQLFAHQQ